MVVSCNIRVTIREYFPNQASPCPPLLKPPLCFFVQHLSRCSSPRHEEGMRPTPPRQAPFNPRFYSLILQLSCAIPPQCVRFPAPRCKHIHRPMPPLETAPQIPSPHFARALPPCLAQVPSQAQAQRAHTADIETSFGLEARSFSTFSC